MTILNNWYGYGVPDGWSARGGQTKSPYDDDLNPMGSSTGSAVAVTAGFCAAAIGAETDGSIVRCIHLKLLVCTDVWHR